MFQSECTLRFIRVPRYWIMFNELVSLAIIIGLLSSVVTEYTILMALDEINIKIGN